ncbi:hypothetical protein Q9233_006728 [Columba guinea]|nr:hypothetical protein Q9233_006728 [Columba guinea]
MGNHGEKYGSNLRAVVSRDEVGHLQGDQVAEGPEGQKVCSKSIQQTTKDLQVLQITSKRPEQTPQEEEKYVKSCLQERGGSQSWSSRLQFLLTETVRFKWVKLKRQAEGVAVSETTATELNVGRGHNRHPYEKTARKINEQCCKRKQRRTPEQGVGDVETSSLPKFTLAAHSVPEE